LAGLTGSTPAEVFRTFREHLNSLLHRTITDAPLSLTQGAGSQEAKVSFGTPSDPIAAALRTKPWHLYLGQTLIAVPEGKRKWRLRTLQYSYWIQDGPSKDDRWFFRFEYVSRELEQFLHPRHHLHMPLQMECPKKPIDLAKAHLPTGWVTVEELIRFLIHSLRVRPRHPNWDTLLRDSEEKFREWTGRSI
jgi:hypothetical protein